MTAGSVLLLPPLAMGRETIAEPADWLVHSDDPPNREVSLEQLIESWLTPTERFYVRSHAVAPQIDAAAFRLTIDGDVRQPLELSLEDLERRFERVEVTATMTCAGNRRTEHSRTRTINGVPWQAGAIGNATWSGWALADVLEAVGVGDESRHVWFDGADRIARGDDVISFGASIPLVKARSTVAGVPGAILCDRMNGEPLTPDHGYPLRTVVPGYIGARSVKWLRRIHLAAAENPNHYQATAYKIVQAGTPIEWAERPPIYRFPLNAVICSPTSGEEVTLPLRVLGYALPPGEDGGRIARIEVSADGGQSWWAAELLDEPQPFCWVRWAAEFTENVPESVLVRATDQRGRFQPVSTPWNAKGYLYNAQDRVMGLRASP